MKKLSFSLIFIISLISIKSFSQVNNIDSIKSLPRDPVGDINSEQVSNAQIPGTVVIARTKFGVLAMGGFFKTLAIADTRSELKIDACLPGFLGIPGVDNAENGQIFMDARATRMTFTALTIIDSIKFKGYIEWNFRGEPTNFSFRLAYLQMVTKSGKGELLFGKYFSNIGDGLSVPDAVSDPTVSGLMVNERQEQIKWTQNFTPGLKWAASIENTPTSDLFGINFEQRNAPALTTNIMWIHPAFKTHFTLAAMLRGFWVSDSVNNYTKAGWIISAGTHFNFSPKTRVQYSITVGEGIGNYMVGTDPLSAGLFIPGTGLELRKTMGHYLSLQHKWNDDVRTNIMSGLTTMEKNNKLPLFLTLYTTQLGINTMWRVKKFLTIGLEYWHDTRRNMNNTTFINNRFVFGMQLF